ncbi:multicopper oxidase-domain-containing protein [Aspergillus cavernicola]|uniref:Multicopper oxidase-domain-containing protein n=1 Tax=Aspergillus cavernicola TaxID=176166 RepID=A0ABR4I3I4_9EURO
MSTSRRGLALPILLLSMISFVYGYGESIKATGNTVSFQITLTWEDSRPAGIARKMILANDQFPAPPLNLKQGDDVEFLVINELPFSTTVHFHGIEQYETPWSDGTPGLSQRPIAPGDSFLYKWRATNYGSYFYHAHKRGQQEDGLYGAIHILSDTTIEKPFAMISEDQYELKAIEKAEAKSSPIILSDVRQLTSNEVWEAEIAMGRDALCANALLVNGKGSVSCLGRQTINQFTSVAQRGVLGNQSLTDIGCLPATNTVAQGTFSHNISAIPPSVFAGCTPSRGSAEQLLANPDGVYVSYDLISAAIISTITFSIDEHPLYVYGIDGQYIEPILVDAITITNGARYSVLVKLDKPAGDYTIRVANTGVNQILNGTAFLTYHPCVTAQEQPSVPSIDIIGVPTSPDYTVLNESTIVPYPSQEVGHVHVAQTQVLKIERYHQSYIWSLGNSSYPLTLEEMSPLLFNPTTGQKDLTISTRNGTWVDLVFDVTNALQPPHPFHKHSNKFFVIGQGEGRWNYSSVAEARQYIPESFNFQTPQIRDTFITPPAATGPTWLAIRYHVVNPGPFLLHCHIQVHQSGGMALALLDGIDEWPEVPEEYQL